MVKVKRFTEGNHKNSTGKAEKPHDETYVLYKQGADGQLEPLAVGFDDCRQTLNHGRNANMSTKQQLGTSAQTVIVTLTQQQPACVTTQTRGQPLGPETAPSTPGITELGTTVKPDPDQGSTPDHHVMGSFKISDEEKLKAYLHEKLISLQQQLVKRLAKAWIKGICPKKQARFPYQNNTRREMDGMAPEIPPWWPAVANCEFKEPDHICKDDRMALCLHILRLRPTVDELREWNSHGDSTELCRRYEIEGWVGLLRSMTPKSIFDGLEPDKPERRKRREKLLEAVYSVAAKEEEYLKNQIDPDSVIYWEKEPKAPRSSRVTACKRSRQSSVASSSGASSTLSEREYKRRRREPAVQSPSTSAMPTSQMSDAMVDKPVYHHTLAQPYTEDLAVAPGHGFVGNDTALIFPHAAPGYPTSEAPYMRHLSADMAPAAYPCSSYPPSVTASFGSICSGTNDGYATGVVHEVPSTSPGKHEYDFSHMASAAAPGSISVFRAYDTPQPVFDTNPNTLLFSPMNTMTGQHGSFQALEESTYHADQQPLDITIVAGQQNYPLNEGSVINTPPQHDISRHHHSSAGFAIPDRSNTLMHSDTYGNMGAGHRDAPIHGLPMVYTEVQRRKPNDQYPYYHETRPEGKLPVGSLPGNVERGFTGHGAGVGGGAPT